MKSVNRDGQQFPKYHQNEQSALILARWTQKEDKAYDVGNTGLGVRRTHKYSRVWLANVYLTWYDKFPITSVSIIIDHLF